MSVIVAQPVPAPLVDSGEFKPVAQIGSRWPKILAVIVASVAGWALSASGGLPLPP